MRGVFEHLIEILSGQFGFKDLIDILIVAYLFYRILLIIRGTRAVQMLMGIGVLLLFFWGGLSYKLYGLSWILTNFFESSLIIVVILFQDQFRSALAYVGGGRGLLSLFRPSASDGPVMEELVEVCGVLQRERVGGLMVIEKRQGLMNYMETGTRLNAIVHSDLIYAIFQSRSPLHDGAIIIAAGKIAAAGCFLPLAKDVDIDRHLGTRHRAALGITENTDAVAITVSEETGKIHIFYQGQLYFCGDERELRRKLKYILTHDRVGPEAVTTRG